MKILIQNGHVLDPLTKRDEVCDVLVENDRIARSGTQYSGECGPGD